MVDPKNPQASQIADESMVRTLAAQASAIWPQERLLLERHAPAADARVLDVGCGTGEWSWRVAEWLPQAQVLGVDVMPELVATAAQRNGAWAPRLSFAVDDGYALAQPDDTFDLVACRHVLQAVPDPELMIAELVRVTRPGGRVHVLSEDYGMLHMTPGSLDPDVLWREGPVAYTARTGTDARIGRRTGPLLRAAGLEEVSVDYVIVDTQRVPRRVFADIITAWRDGYVEPMARGSRLSAAEFRAHFDAVIASILDPLQYAVWMIPIVSGRKRAN